MTPKAKKTTTKKATKKQTAELEQAVETAARQEYLKEKHAKKASRKEELTEKLAEQAMKIEIAEQAAKIEAGTSVESAEPITLTDDELTAVRNAVHATYQVIASDAGLRENARPAEILEVVLDSDHVHTYGRLSTELYGKFDAWLQQELKAARSMGAGLRKLVPLIWEAPKAAARHEAKPEATDKPKREPKPSKAADEQPTQDISGLPIDPKAPAGATLKACPICKSVRVPKTWHFCNSCWDLKKAARAAAKKGAAALNGKKEDRPTVN